MIVAETPSLRLRRWLPADREPFAKLNADPRVMEFLGGVLTREESDAAVDRIEAHFEQHGFGRLAIELRETGAFIGAIGPAVVAFEAHFTPCVEIGWRLAFESWGRGFATEAARAVLENCDGDVVAFTVRANLRSRRVMEKVGMTHDPADDFDHPNLPEEHPLRRHVLYRAGGSSR